MLYIATALFIEAAPIIEQYQLKQENKKHIVALYKAKDIILWISGTGMIASASALSHIATLYPPQKDDLLIQVGSCGSLDSENQLGSLFLVNKIVNFTNKKTFYPDMLIRTGLKEKGLISLPTVYYKNMEKEKDYFKKELLFDMEGAGFYEAAKFYFKCHQIFIVKILTDHGKTKQIKLEEFEFWMEKSRNQINEFLNNLLIKSVNFENPDAKNPDVKNPDAENARNARNESNEKKEKIARSETSNKSEYLTELYQQLHFTETMRHSLQQYLLYYELKGDDPERLIKEVLKKGFTGKNKKMEGKRYFEEIRRMVLS